MWQMLEERIQELKKIVVENDGTNADDWRFARAVDDLLNAVYDDVDRLKQLSPRALFDLFILKVLYVGRRSRHADVVDYLGRLLTSNLYTGQLNPPDGQGKPSTMYFSNMLDDRFENRFEAYRSYGDNALFVSGVFPASLKPRRSSRRTPMRRAPARTIDGEYYVTTGKTMYRMAANDSGAPATREPETLLKLAEHFEIYVDALNEMSERYIVGFDMELIADKMLDNFNRYRETGEERSLDQARRYASLLRIDRQRFSSLFPPD